MDRPRGDRAPITGGTGLATARRCLCVLAGAAAACPAGTASAHVKWFAPYIVGAPPAPITRTLGDRWFWLGIGLVLTFFVLTRLVERGAHGPAVLTGLDRLTEAIWTRLDDYVRAITAAFFIAIFSVGGVYLTPDLRTPAEWVSWMQLLIAAAIFWRATMPLAGAGIVALWLLALPAGHDGAPGFPPAAWGLNGVRRAAP